MDSRIIVENALDPIITVDAAGRILSWNPAAETVFMLTAEEAVGRPFAEVIQTASEQDDDILPPSRAETFHVHVERLVRLRDSDQELPMGFSISHLALDTRKLYVIFVRDISRSWYREKKLQYAYQNQRIMNSILKVSLMPVPLVEQLELILDLILSIPTIDLLPNGAILLVDETHQTLGVRVHRGFSPQQLATCRSIPFGKCHCGRAADSGAIQFVSCIDERHDFMFDKMAPHGHYCVPVLSGETVLGVIALYIREGHEASELEKETLAAIANIVAGIIERNNLEEQMVLLVEDLRKTIADLNDEKKFNESIIGSLERGLFILDRDNRVEKVNPAGARLAADLFGQHRPEKKSVFELFGQEIAQQMIPLSRPDTHGGNEIEVQAPDGRQCTIECNTVQREDATGRVLGLIISLRDITGARKIQLEMEKMNRFSTIAEIASAVAHEVRNPLAGIKTMAQVVFEQLARGDARREYVSRIIKQVDRLNEMLTDFFAYARPSEPQRKKVSVPALLQEINPLVQSRLAKKKIVLREKYQVGLPKVLVDPNQAQQVFLNLLFNSMDAIQGGGEIEVAAEYFSPDQVREKQRKYPWLMEGLGYVQVGVVDTGCGIPDENLENILNPFYTTKHDGTGLGLAIVYRILKENNAGIHIDNKRPQGVRMLLFFPVEQDHG